MTDKQTIFRRAYDAIVDARMRRAEHELRQYSDFYDINPRREARKTR